MRERGVLEPLIVAPGLEEAGVVLIAGHRRLAAAKLAKLATVPTIFRSRRAQEADAAERQRAERRRESLGVAAKVRHDFTRDLLQRPGLGGKAAAPDAARFVVAAIWEFIAEAYDWGADELGEFADLIGVQIDQEPTWG